MKVLLTISADQNKCIPVNRWITYHGKRSFEWSSNWMIKESFSHLDCLENNVSGWTVKKTSSRTGRLKLVGTDVSYVYSK